MEDLLIRTGRVKMARSRCHWIVMMAFVGTCAYVVAACTTTPTTDTHESSAVFSPVLTTSSIAPTIREVIPYYATDVKDPRRLAGLADTVFAGTVTEVVGPTIRYGQANTRFKARVLTALKGSPTGDVTVEQEGGHDGKANITYIVKDDTKLQTGSAYLFATMHRADENLYSIIPVYGNVALTPEDAGALSAGNTSKPVADMQDAIKHQIPS